MKPVRLLVRICRRTGAGRRLACRLPWSPARTPPRRPNSAVEVPAEYAALREQGIALHSRAVEGDEDAAGKAVAQLERYLERFSTDIEARAYLGSAYTLMARDASSVVNRMRYANRGLRHLDRALDSGPGSSRCAWFGPT